MQNDGLRGFLFPALFLMFDQPPKTIPPLPTFFRILLLSLAVLTARAGDGVAIHSTPAWLRPVPAVLSGTVSSAEVSDGYYFLLMDRQVNLGCNTEYTHVIRKVVNATGVQNASEISVHFAPQFQHLVFHQAVIVRNGKVIDQLKRDRIKVVHEEAEAEKFIYQGIKRAYITLLDVQPGDRIEYAYSLEGFNPVFGRRYSGDYFFNGFTPYANYFISILAPAGRSLKIKTFNGATQPESFTSGNLTVYRWSNPAIDLTDSKAETPSWYTHAPYACVTEFDGWKEVVDWGLETFNQYRFSLPASMEKRIAGWREQSAGDRDLLAALALRFVQDRIRYLGLEIGSNTHKPRDPSAVCLSGFGDCKDKALLLATILRHENIEAYVALLNTTDRWMLNQSLAAPNQFDHAIVAIKRDSGYFFVDPTISLQRGGLVNSFVPPYGYALVLKPGEKGLEAVNQPLISKAEITESLDVASGRKGKFSVKTVYTGAPADAARSNFAGSSLKALGESFTDYYSKTYEGIEMMSVPEMKDDSGKNEMTILESYLIPHPWQKENKGRPAFNTYVKSIDERLPAVPSDPGKTPLALRYPQTVSYTLKLKMPEEFSTDFEPVHIKNASYQFDFSQQQGSGNTLVYKYYLKTFRDHIPAGEVVQFKEDYARIADCLSFRFTRGDDVLSPLPTSPAPAWNWILTWISFGLLVCITAVFRYYNQRSQSRAK